MFRLLHGTAIALKDIDMEYILIAFAADFQQRVDWRKKWSISPKPKLFNWRSHSLFLGVSFSHSQLPALISNPKGDDLQSF